MVRKITTLICVLAIVLCFSIPTQAASINPDDYEYFLVATNGVFFDPMDSRVKLWLDTHINSIPIGYDYVITKQVIEDYGEFYYIVVSNEFYTEDSGNWSTYIFSDNADVYSCEIIQEGYHTQLQSYYLPDANICIESFGDDLISSLADYPDMMERSYYAETLNTILLVVLLLSFVLSAFFRSR